MFLDKLTIIKSKDMYDSKNSDKRESKPMGSPPEPRLGSDFITVDGYTVWYATIK